MEAGADARIGRTFGKYTLERVIGTGGMSIVYEARHHNGHRVAVKLLKPELSINADVRARFLREGYAANRVDHPGVVRILDDHTTEDGAVFLVLELLEGETLAAKTAAGRLPVCEVVALGRQLLQILSAAHSAGVIHRDIKPENVLVQPDGVIKVLDFGIAQIREPSASSVTATGRMLGTPAFMPPEQAYGRRREIDERSDVWAAGATLFTMLAGRVVHQATTAEETLIKAATEAPPPLRSVAADIPTPLALVIDRALEREKEARWPSADAMLIALEAATAEPADAVTPPPSRSQVARFSLVLAALVCASAWFLRSPPPTIAYDEPSRDPVPALGVTPAIVRDIAPKPDARAIHLEKPAPREAPPAVSAEGEPALVPTVCGFDIDEEGRRWPRRCPNAH